MQLVPKEQQAQLVLLAPLDHKAIPAHRELLEQRVQAELLATLGCRGLPAQPEQQEQPQP